MRSLSTIASDIQAHWAKPYFGAVPYIDAMARMDSVANGFGEDAGKDVILRFLSNASTWRGADARRVKAELKSMIA